MTIPDFQSLLSRDKNLQPSRVTQIISREAFKPPPDSSSKRDLSSMSANHQEVRTQYRVGSGNRGRMAVFKVDGNGSAQPVSPDHAQAFLDNTTATNVSTDNSTDSETKKKMDEDDVIEEIEGGSRHQDGYSHDNTCDYYIVGDDRLSCPYEYNSQEYIVEKFLGEGNGRGSELADSILKREQFDTTDTDTDTDNEQDSCLTKKDHIDKKLNNARITPSSSHKLVIEDPSTLCMPDSYLHYVARGGQMNSRNRSSSSINNNTRDRCIIQSRRKAEELAYQLSLYTPVCNGGANGTSAVQHAKAKQKALLRKNDSVFNSISQMDTSERVRLEQQRKSEEQVLLPAFHEVELGDWEKKIDWEGYISDKERNHHQQVNVKESNKGTIGDDKTGKINPANEKMTNNTSISSAITNSLSASFSQRPIKPLDPNALLNHPVNPYLDALDFSSLISWEGADAPPGYNHGLANRVGQLILEKGVAGSSIAKTCGAMILSNTSGSTSLNPQPFNQTQIFQNRMERVNGVGVGSMGKLQTDVAKRAKEIAQRQLKRARMAIDKTNRIEGALGTLDMGSLGRGRTITSSLMGPGGTERTGRPSGRGGLSSVAHDMECVDELELVYDHVLVKPDLRKGELRQLHRAKLPRRMFRPGDNVPWQFQIMLNKNQNIIKGGRCGAATAAVVPGNLLTQTKIRNEADLSPMEGNLILLEYSEEHPPIVMSKGMTCKIVNYYRGDRSKCPISVGGGDRPTRKKKHGDKAQDSGALRGGSGKVEKPPRLKGPGAESTADLIGKIGMKSNAGIDSTSKSPQKKSKESSVTILPEGVTEILHIKVHGPFIGSIQECVMQTGMISNIFAAPIFRHEARSTDFLMILGKRMGLVGGGRGKLGVILRPIPSSVFCVGQVEPRVKVFAPSSTLEKDFMGRFTSYQIAKGLQRMQAKEDCGLKIDEIEHKIFPNTEKLVKNTLRQRIKEVARYDKNTQIWTLKKEGEGGFSGVEALGRQVLPSGVAAYEKACAAVRRLRDLGIIQLCTESNSATNVTAAMVYLSGAIGAARERKEALSKRAKAQNPQNKGKQTELYSKAEEKLKTIWKDLKRKGEVARYIQEELLLAPWHLSSEFIDVHKDEKGTGMMKLTGLGDPSGRTEAFNFLREADPRPNKGPGNTDGALNTRIKKITGTEDDLRKLNMKQMAEILQSYNMGMKEVSKLKRWDRVHVIRDLSTKAASDKMGDGFERYARGEKMKLSEQREQYRKRIQAIWEKQRTALTTDAGQYDFKKNVEGAPDTTINVNKAIEEDSDDDSSDLFDEFEKEEGERGEFLNLQQRQKEERIANAVPVLNTKKQPFNKDRKVIRRKITKKHPDGIEKVYFKFIVKPSEVEKIRKEKITAESRITADDDDKKKNKKKKKTKLDYFSESVIDVNNANIGHALFEDDDEEPSRVKAQPIRKPHKRRQGNVDPPARVRKPPKKKPNNQKPSHRRTQKRKRAEEENEVYLSRARLSGNSNRREAGSARARKPHVIMADRLEQIRSDLEKRDLIGPFMRPVDKRKYSKYYEVISNPIDLQTIRDKIKRYEYKNVDAFVSDFEVMMNNAVKFNGVGSSLGTEATSVYECVKDTVAENRADFDNMECAVREQMQNSGRKKSLSSASSKNAITGEKDRKGGKGTSGGGNTKVDIRQYLGDDLKSSLQFDGTTSNQND